MIGKGQGRARGQGEQRANCVVKQGLSAGNAGRAEGDKRSRGLRSRIEELYNDWV